MWPCCRTGRRVPPDRQRSIQRHDAAHRMTTQHDTDAPLRRSLRLAHNNALRQPRSHRIHRILQRATRGIRRVHLVLDAQARIRLQHKMRQPLRIPLKGRLSTPSKPACKHSAVRPTHARRQAAPCQGAVPPPPRRSRCPCREVEVTFSACPPLRAYIDSYAMSSIQRRPARVAARAATFSLTPRPQLSRSVPPAMGNLCISLIARAASRLRANWTNPQS